jgi:CcmD family protein
MRWMRHLLPMFLIATSPSFAAAQGGPANPMRAYWHVVIAYAVLWLVVGGWIYSIVRRLARIERRLGDRDA